MFPQQLLKISDLGDAHLGQLFEHALRIKKAWEQDRSPPLHSKQFSGPLGLVFLEPSTRTRVAFERSAQVLGQKTVLVEARGTSFEKGETLADSLLVLESLGIHRFVIRTPETGGLETFRLQPQMGLINAGDGTGEHPTQALLDAAALIESYGRPDALRGLRMVGLGDVSHSRVARSWSELAPRLGIELSFCGPASWKPKGWGEQVEWHTDKAAALKDADIILVLRVQKERLEPEEVGSAADNGRSYQLSVKDLTPERRFLHPGPTNWGVELGPELRGHPQSLIVKQLKMSLALRSALLDLMEKEFRR